MRGIGAIAVLQFHAAGDLPVAQSGYLAVDFFFALSGFVIARAYEPKLRSGMSTREFFIARVVRLYPLYAVGIAIGAIVLARSVLNGSQTVHDFSLALAFNAFMLPAPLDAAANFFPLNNPSWTLFFEMVINVAFAAVAVHMSTKRLFGVVVALAVALTIAILREDWLGGWNWATFHIGLLRVAFSFGVGVLIARTSGAPIRTPFAIVPILILLAMLYFPHDLDDTAILAIPSILFVSPLILMMGTRLELPAKLASIGIFMGAISYPLYIVHAPLLSFAERIVGRLGTPPIANLMLVTLALMVVAYFINSIVSKAMAYLSGQTVKRSA